MLKILYEDNHLIAVLKPAGVLVQEDISKDTNLMDLVKNFLKERDKKPGNVFLGLLHRLDRPASGIVLFAKTSKGASRLSEQFRDRTIKKTYTALVEGRVAPPSGTLTHYLQKDEQKKIARVSETLQPDYAEAELSYEVLRLSVNCSLLSVDLHTGRFHQIRAQLSAIGHPIVGDKKYGSKEKLPDGNIALCATELEFMTPTTKESVRLSIPYPDDWDVYLK